MDNNVVSEKTRKRKEGANNWVEQGFFFILKSIYRYGVINLLFGRRKKENYLKII